MIGGLDTYWASNPEWTEFYRNELGQLSERLTDKAPEKARKSWENYCKQIARIAELERKTGAHYW